MHGQNHIKIGILDIDNCLVHSKLLIRLK